MPLVPFPSVGSLRLAADVVAIHTEHFETIAEGRTGKISVRKYGDDVAGRMRGLLRFWPFPPADKTSQKMAQALDQYLDDLYDAPSTDPYGVIPLNELMDKANDTVIFKTPPNSATILRQNSNSSGELVTTFQTSWSTLNPNMFISASPSGSRWGGRKPVMRVKRVLGHVAVLRPYHKFPANTQLHPATELFFRVNRDRPRPEVIFSNTERNAPLFIPWIEYLE